MLTQAIAKAFDQLHSRTIRLPWTGPAGQHWEMEIRPHDNSDYQTALAASGVKPLGTAARRPRTDDEEEMQGDLMAAVVAGADKSGQKRALERIQAKIEFRKARKEKFDSEIHEIVTLLEFPWEGYDVCYSLSEAATMAPHVRRHLVVAGWEVSHDGERREMSAEELDLTFASTAIIPGVVEVSVPNGDGRPKVTQEVYALRGKPEGAAVAGVVLRESVKAHLFMERVVGPLGIDSSSGPPAEDTSPPLPTSEPEPPPDSPSDFTAVP